MSNDEKNGAGQAPGIDGYLFRLIATFEAAAMQQMGKIAHPLTGEVEVDLQGASDSIEMLAAIHRKTEGNLNDDEKRLLDHVLYQLRMNYVDVAAEQAKKTDGEADAGAPEPATDGAEEATGDAGSEDAASDTDAPDSEKETV